MDSLLRVPRFFSSSVIATQLKFARRGGRLALIGKQHEESVRVHRETQRESVRARESEVFESVVTVPLLPVCSVGSLSSLHGARLCGAGLPLNRVRTSNSSHRPGGGVRTPGVVVATVTGPTHRPCFPVFSEGHSKSLGVFHLIAGVVMHFRSDAVERTHAEGLAAHEVTL